MTADRGFDPRPDKVWPLPACAALWAVLLLGFWGLVATALRWWL